MKKSVEMTALVFDQDRYGNVTLHREKRVEELEFYADDRHRELCNICKHQDYPGCRKDCRKDRMWRKRNGVTL